MEENSPHPCWAISLSPMLQESALFSVPPTVPYKEQPSRRTHIGPVCWTECLIPSETQEVPSSWASRGRKLPGKGNPIAESTAHLSHVHRPPQAGQLLAQMKSQPISTTQQPTAACPGSPLDLKR